MAPISRIKEMGLPATGKVTLASAVVMVMVWALDPGLVSLLWLDRVGQGL